MRIQDLMALQYIVRRVFQIELLLALRLMNGGDIGNDLRIPFLIFHGNIVECAHLFLPTKSAFLVNYSRFYEKSQWCWEIIQERQGHPKRADGTERSSANRSIFLLKKTNPDQRSGLRCRRLRQIASSSAIYWGHHNILMRKSKRSLKSTERPLHRSA